MNKRAPMREPEPKKPPQREPSNTPPSRKEPPPDEPPREEPDDSGSPMKVGRGHGDGCSIAYRLTNTCLKITIEADGQIVIVMNLAGMPEANLVDESPQLGFRTPRILCTQVRSLESLLHFVQERQYRTAYSDVAVVGLTLKKGGYHGTTIG
jgi:hypothetical protein